MNADLVERLRTVVSKHFDVPPESIREEASFITDLGADSLDVVQLAMTIEEAFSLEIPDADYIQFQTVGQALQYIERRLEARGLEAAQ
jgi:acyl carrier protein